MKKRDGRLNIPWVPQLELQTREWIHETLAHRASAQVFWDCPIRCEESSDFGFDYHTASALWAGLGFIEALVSLYKPSEDILVSVEDLEDLFLIHLFEDHQVVVYLNGGPCGLPN